MIKPSVFYDLLVKGGADFFSGVPDSLLKFFCAYVTDHAPEDRHIIAANEGAAVALASGYYFATGRIPLVYMQNSGIGNAVNPLLSLADPDVYSVPVLLVVGWRGEPGVRDEPQHVKQGKVTCALFDAMQIPYAVLTDDEAALPAQLETAFAHMRERSAPYALIVRKGTFDRYDLVRDRAAVFEMRREQAIEKIMLAAPENAAFVSTTGMISRELYELREKHGMEHCRDFLTVGSMGHASQIALAVAMQGGAHGKKRPVFCLDGDGASLMHMGSMAVTGTRRPSNFCHFVLNNGAHDSVGGQPTVGLEIDLPAVARACGYQAVFSVSTAAELDGALAGICADAASGGGRLTFVEVKVCKGARGDLGRPKSSPEENKRAFMEFLKRQNP